jgi:hypothetical protein
MTKKLSCLLLLCVVFLAACEKPYEEKEIERTDPRFASQLSEFECLLIDGMSAKLEQIYLMPNDGTVVIPIVAKPAAELLDNDESVVNLIFQTTEYINDYIMSGLHKGEIWHFSFEEVKGESSYYELGYGSTYMVMENAGSSSYYEIIESDNPYSPRLFISEWNPGSLYNYRGHDNIIFSINSHIILNEWAYTNLKLEVLTRDGNALFDDGYFYLDTNSHYELAYRYTPPLTGTQVAQTVQNGVEGVDYELYLWRGLTTYKIGENLYIPTIGGTYKYIASSNQNGMPGYIKGQYYRLKFKILETEQS